MSTGNSGDRPARRPARERTARLLVIIPVVLGLLFLVVFAAIPPVLVGDMVNRRVAFAQVWSGEEYDLTPEKLTLVTSDGLALAAYAVHVEEPKAVIIFLSGIHNPSVTAFFGHARMMLDHGYASILVEMRAHGESEGNVIALGFEEHRDTQAAVDYIKADHRYARVPIVAYGLSMGAATAINSIGQIPEIGGLISLSAYSSWDDVFVDNMGVPEPLASIQRLFVRLYTTAKYGVANRGITPRNQIRNLGDRPALLIHSTGDSQIPYRSMERLVASAPPHVETWMRQGDLHLIVRDGSFTNPEQDIEYADRILGFLDRHFGK